MAISTPIGFSLSDFHGSFGVNSLSFNSAFTGINIFHRSTAANSNGVADAMIGFRAGRYGSFSMSYEIISSVLDQVQNFQYQAPIGGDHYGVSVGVQDIQNHGGASGEGTPASESDNSRSVFIAATDYVTKNTYVTLGKGDRRFKNGIFGNVSYGPTPRTKLIGEYDTYGWNYGVAYGLGPISWSPFRDRKFEPVITAGMVAGKRAYWMLNFPF